MNGSRKGAKRTLGTGAEVDAAPDPPRTHSILRPAKKKTSPLPPRYLFRAWDEIADQVGNAELCALLLDFDGALVKLQRRPSEVRVPQRTRRMLERLANNPKLFVAIVSGRRRQDLQTRIGVKTLRCIGLHGAEIEGRNTAVNKEAKKILALAKQGALKQIGPMRGMRIEDKGLSFAVHYRGTAAQVASDAKSCLLELVTPLRKSLKMFEGAMVWEVLPNEIQGKGAAARALLDELPQGTVAIYIGDDGTDESAFRTLSDQITVRVGMVPGSRAKYYLRNPAEVIRFLWR